MRLALCFALYFANLSVAGFVLCCLHGVTFTFDIAQLKFSQAVTLSVSLAGPSAFFLPGDFFLGPIC